MLSFFKFLSGINKTLKSYSLDDSFENIEELDLDNLTKRKIFSVSFLTLYLNCIFKYFTGFQIFNKMDSFDFHPNKLYKVVKNNNLFLEKKQLPRINKIGFVALLNDDIDATYLINLCKMNGICLSVNDFLKLGYLLETFEKSTLLKSLLQNDSKNLEIIDLDTFQQSSYCNSNLIL